MLSVRQEEKSTGRLHKDGGAAVNVVMKSECCPLDRKRSLLVVSTRMVVLL